MSQSPGEWIEEGLFYHGPAAPVDETWAPEDWVEVPHESYISAAKWQLDEALLDAAGADRQKFDHLLRLIEGLLHFRHHDTLNELKKDYQLFAPDGASRNGVGDGVLVDRQRRFLSNFMQAMVKGNFLPFGAEDFKRASEQTYLLDVPVIINWSSHDPQLIDDFLTWADGDGGAALREELGIEGPVREFLAAPDEVGTNALVFYRGIDRDQAEGRFIGQRLDILVDRTIKVLTFPVVAPLQWIVDKLRRRSEELNVAEAHASPPAGNGESRSTVFERRWVRRKNLRNTPLFRSFFRPTRLQEPVLRQVIVLFRSLPKKVDKAAGGIVGKNGHDGTRDWSIHLKMFQHIPMADAEIVFPDKKVRMGSFDLAVLIISSLAAVPAVINAVAKGSSGALVVAGALCLYMVKVIGRFLRVRGKYLARMTRNLYEKNLDNSFGVLQYLVDSLEEQEYKEAVLAYFVLWRAGKPMTEAELDGAVEHFVHEQFAGLEIDFEVDDALRKVVGTDKKVMLPIVERLPGDGDGEPRYRARPLDEALRLLDERWDHLLNYNA
jgi:hypothetical protein